MALLKLTPSYKDYIWGGQRLVKEYNKKYDGKILAESWELSCHPDGPSFIQNGPHTGKALSQYIDDCGQQVLGKNCEKFEDFPILIKFIDANDNLSIQVHPNDAYALANEGQYGKTEMWYVMDCGKDAFLYYGFKEQITAEEFEQRIQNNTLLEVLNKVYVQKGDILFIEAGTIHAIGANILIAEIQQNSNLTYRVYDFGRLGKDGKPRQLHIQQALKVTDRIPLLRSKTFTPHVAQCDYFTVDKLYLDGTTVNLASGFIDDASFVSLLFLSGEGRVENGKETLSFQKGDSFFLSAGSGEYTIRGACEVLITTIR